MQTKVFCAFATALAWILLFQAGDAPPPGGLQEFTVANSEESFKRTRMLRASETEKYEQEESKLSERSSMPLNSMPVSSTTVSSTSTTDSTISSHQSSLSDMIRANESEEDEQEESRLSVLNSKAFNESKLLVGNSTAVYSTIVNSTNTTNSTNSSYQFSFRDMIDPDTLPPYWFLSLSGSGIVVLTLAVFGVSIKFEEKKEPSPIWDCVACMGKNMMSMVFIALALNSWRADIQEFSRVPATGFSHSFYALLVIWVTSPNYKAAVALYTSIEASNPEQIFGGKLKFSKIPFTEVPWLPPLNPSSITLLKWIYAIVLLPYKIPNDIVPGLLSILSCVCKFSVIFSFFKATCCCLIYVVLVIVTFFCWGQAKNTVADYWWNSAWPFYYLSFLQLYSYCIAALFFFGYILYLALTKGIYFDRIPVIKIFGFEKVLPDDSTPPEHVKAQLWQFQDAGLQNAFEEGHVYTSLEEVTKADLIAAEQCFKLELLGRSLRTQANIMITQIAVIMGCRILVSTGREGYFKSAVATVTERKISVYCQYLQTSAKAASEKSLKFTLSHPGRLDFLKGPLNALWNLL